MSWLTINFHSMDNKLGRISPIFILTILPHASAAVILLGALSLTSTVTLAQIQNSYSATTSSVSKPVPVSSEAIFDIENLSVSKIKIEQAWNELVQKKSFDKRQWKKLLHIEKDILYRERSQVSDPGFFLSLEGFKNPQQEMRKTLESYFWQENQLGKLYKNENPPYQHPICKFPARLKFLKKELPENELWQSLPTPNCYYLNLFVRSLNVQSVSFVFSSYYADSPGSAFGHTFFRINKKEREGVKKQELLDYGISYAANVTTENALVYALFGLMGGFTGTYTNVPYYYKVREYNDFESRDLWAYELALTEEEQENLILHFWEIGSHYFTYYFFTQNCSYQMLTALEAAAPRLYLTESLPIFVIPADSVKVLFTVEGLVKNVEFRPSLKRQFDARYEKLSPSEKDIFIEYVKTKKLPAHYEPLSEQRKSLLIDTVLDYSDLKDPHGIAGKKGDWYTFKEQNLIARAKIDFISEELKIPTPALERPDISHPSSRLAIGGGEKRTFFEFRFALHDLMDSKVGLPKYSQLEFGHFKFSNQDNSTYLDHFSFFKVQQMNPWKALEKKPSWSLDLGAKRFDFCDNRKGCFGSGFKALFGYSAAFHEVLLWVMPVLEYRYGEFFEQERHRYAYGINVGVIYNFSDKHRFQYYHEKQKFNVNGELEENFFEYRFNLAKNKSISLISEQTNWRAMFYYYF